MPESWPADMTAARLNATCRCPFGWSGSECSQLALPACRLELDGPQQPIHCDLRQMPWRPSCECQRQCRAHIQVGVPRPVAASYDVVGTQQKAALPALADGGAQPPSDTGCMDEDCISFTHARGTGGSKPCHRTDVLLRICHSLSLTRLWAIVSTLLIHDGRPTSRGPLKSWTF